MTQGSAGRGFLPGPGGRRHGWQAIRALEADHPKLAGWILDEQGHIRRHVNVFVNGERVGEDARVQPADRLHILPSISGGSR